jgi:predicted site-specific integrase-resolvase
MKLSQYARQLGVSYKTAWRWWKSGRLDAYQTETGTIIVREAAVAPSGVALYARVSSADQREDADRQIARLRDYAAARGYQVAKEVVEIASGLNDQRPKLTKLLTDPGVGVIVVEHKDRLTRFGYHYIVSLLEMQERRIEPVFPTDTGDDLVDDFVAVITSMAARLYGRRHSKRRAARLQQCIKRCVEQSSDADAHDPV